MQKVPWIANDTRYVIKLLEERKFYQRPVLCTIDVEALYTNIIQSEGLSMINK